MAIHVTIEGQGKVAEFPDGTDPAVIDKVIQRDYFSQTTKTAATPAPIGGVAIGSPAHRQMMADFIRTNAARDFKQEAVRGLPMGNRMADASMGTYNDPVHPERTVNAVLGSQVSPTTGGAMVQGLSNLMTNPGPQIEGAIAFPADFATGSVNAVRAGNVGKFAKDTIKGIAAPTGLADLASGDMSFPEARNAWENNFLGSAMVGYGAGLAKGAASLADLGKTTVAKALPDTLPARLTRSALKPYIGESAARNAQTAKGIETFLTDKNASPRLSKFFDTNMQEMQDIVGRQNIYLDEKGNTRASVAPIEQQLETFINDARETPGTADAAVSAAEKVLNDIKSHPDYRAADNSLSTETLQSMKTNTWNHLRKKNAFNSDANPVLNDAMWEAATGMNEIITKVIPEMAGENARYGELANVNKLVKRAIDRHANNNIIPLRALIQLVRGDAAGFASAASMWAFDHPTFKSYIAQRLAKAQGRPATNIQIEHAIDEIKADPMFNPEVLPGKQSSQMDVIPGSDALDLESGGTPGPEALATRFNPTRIPLNLSVGDRGAAANTVNAGKVNTAPQPLPRPPVYPGAGKVNTAPQPLPRPPVYPGAGKVNTAPQPLPRPPVYPGAGKVNTAPQPLPRPPVYPGAGKVNTAPQPLPRPPVYPGAGKVNTLSNLPGQPMIYDPVIGAKIRKKQ